MRKKDEDQKEEEEEELEVVSAWSRALEAEKRKELREARCRSSFA